jgi:hypothetical protein
MKIRRFVLALFALMLAAAFTGAPAAFADPPKPGAKCNSGGGNGSETDPANDCDPGNSGGNNNGKD